MTATMPAPLDAGSGSSVDHNLCGLVPHLGGPFRAGGLVFHAVRSCPSYRLHLFGGPASSGPSFRPGDSFGPLVT